jgi:Cu-Zn family superoxide dismutase
MKRQWSRLLLLTLGIPAIACTGQTGHATIAAISPDSRVAGEAQLEQTGEGLRITVRISNAPAGLHGFHIHDGGSCENGGKAAGGHYNPDGVQHGDLLRDGTARAHAGDLGNLEGGADGTGSFTRVFPPLTLSGGQYPVGGRAFILHAQPDDFGQPTGNAGARIACGQIVLSSR